MLVSSDQYTFVDRSGEMLQEQILQQAAGQAIFLHFKHQDGSKAHNTSYSANTEQLFLNGQGDLSVKLITHVHLEQMFSMSGYRPFLSLVTEFPTPK
jgi:transcriptional regulatory protein LevR